MTSKTEMNDTAVFGLKSNKNKGERIINVFEIYDDKVYNFGTRNLRQHEDFIRLLSVWGATFFFMETVCSVMLITLKSTVF